ncbi:hypothetical protein [Moorena sp. SIO3H5]|uniref:hypothetical protein n=1 Tax=Moorena sp. SIO3H5 TaxID=2607834 RepID=UPI0013BBFF7C|nr:hypothetical protein [Moorena sp. SIO3H5]NEO73260.1 hypothetical protein [Moorena sp. SIO3H5]
MSPGETPKTALHRCSLLPAPCSLLPAPCSLKTRNLYLTIHRIAINHKLTPPVF